MGKSCGKHEFFSLGGQYYSLGHPTTKIMIECLATLMPLALSYNLIYSEKNLSRLGNWDIF